VTMKRSLPATFFFTHAVLRAEWRVLSELGLKSGPLRALGGASNTP
jgi:hypothetical protein